MVTGQSLGGFGAALGVDKGTGIASGGDLEKELDALEIKEINRNKNDINNSSKRVIYELSR